MKNKILQEFLNSNIKIKSQEKLNEYIDFCIENDEEKHTIFSTEHHHILPKASDCFPKFINLKIYNWNGVHLSYENHYIAHSLLFEAVSNISVSYSFKMLSNFKRRTSSILYSEAKKISAINHSNFQNTKGYDGLTNAKRAGKKISATRLNEDWKNTVGKEAIKKVVETKNSEIWKKTIGNESVKKAKITNSEIQSNGKTKAQNTALKGLKTCRETLEENGKTISENMVIKRQEKMKPKQKEVTEKMRISRHKVEENGLTSFQNGSKKGGETRRLRGRHFKVFKSDNSIMYNKICLRDLKEISEALLKTSKEKPLGSTTRSKNAIIKNNKEYLLGYYIKEIK